MPVHDWTRVGQGIFHAFHCAWITEIQRVLNTKVLPPGYYALAEQVTGTVLPDVLTLELTPRGREGADFRGETSHAAEGGGLAVAVSPPKVAIVDHAEELSYATLRKTVVIRHATDHRIVAFIEIVSLGNKVTSLELDRFLVKACSALKQRIHLLLIDLYPPGHNDPNGMHGALWNALGQSPFTAPLDKPLQCAAYEAAAGITAYVEPLAVGAPLPEMPVFLQPGYYVNVPLGPTYAAAFETLPAFWRAKLE
jgi:hypothetical protein